MEMRFVADSMLGKLARWLRLAGHDVVYVGDLDIRSGEDDALVQHAVGEGRVLLTRDVDLHRKARRAGAQSVLVEAEDVVKQLAEVSKRCGGRMRIDIKSSRCPTCNGLLEEADRSEVEGKVPAAVIEAQREFWRCLGCGKVYWQGSHWRTIMEMMARYDRMVGRC